MNIRTKKNKETRRAKRTRARLFSSHRGRKIRLSVHRSVNNIYAQVIDENGKVLASANSLQIPDDKRAKMTKKEEAAEVGKKIAEEALAEKLEKVCFDRGQFRYHGRIESLATAARKAGLQF